MVSLTEDILQILHARKIYFFPKPKSGHTIRDHKAKFEIMPQHGLEAFSPLGAYSYSHSALDGVQTVGRYCSIAENVEVMGNGHPTQWVSSSPVFYNPKRLNRFGVVGLSVDLQNVKGALQSGMTSGLGKVCVCDAGFGSVTVQSSLQVPSSRVMSQFCRCRWCARADNQIQNSRSVDP